MGVQTRTPAIKTTVGAHHGAQIKLNSPPAKSRLLRACGTQLVILHQKDCIFPWEAHTLTGDRKGTWSLTVTRNWRLTFLIDSTAREIYDVNLEDYH